MQKEPERSSALGNTPCGGAQNELKLKCNVSVLLN